MSKGFQCAVVLVLVSTTARGHLAWPESDLQPVQGLYIKRSSDGTTGDLYVAATEESGASSQWLTDQPVNFLAAGSHPQPSALPLFSALSSNALLHEESTTGTQKRAAITGPAAKYAYGMASEPNYSPYPYAAGIHTPKTEALPATSTKSEATPTPAPAVSAFPQYPYHYLYPHMMHAAYANALRVLKDSGVGSEDTSNSNAITSYPTAYWPAASYYPMQYLMMDPTVLAKSHAAALSASTTTATPIESDDENNTSE